MNRTLLVNKCGGGIEKPQGENGRYCRRAALALAAGLIVTSSVNTAANAQSSTSPLEILRSAPKVRLENDPTPRPTATPRSEPLTNPAPQAPYIPPQQQQPVPYVPPRGPAPPIETVYPALTPYAGASTRGNQPAPGYAVPVTPTPRPVLGPEDVEPEERKRGGIVRGLFRAIPFVGGDDDDEEPQQTPLPMADDPRLQPAPPVYRGLETPEIAAPRRDIGDDTTPLLLPPGSTPFPGDPEPTSPGMRDLQEGNSPVSPPILTPEPRFPQPIDAAPDVDGRSPGYRDEPAASTDAPRLTVKRESDVDITTDTTTTQPDDAPADSTAPGSTDPAPVSPTPRELERATTSVIIQESRPRAATGTDSSLGPQPDASATRVDAFDPTARSTSPLVEPPEIAGSAQNDEITSLTIEQADLGMPNPAYEQNTAVLAEFQGAVRLARDSNFAAAAKAFRDYARNHPSSGLAPRAAYLSVIFEKSRSEALKNFESLESAFPDSRYVAEAEKRRGDELDKARTPAQTVVAGIDVQPAGGALTATQGSPVNLEVAAESRRQQINRLEKDLTAAVGDAVREPVLRKRLGELYIEQEEFDRAYEILLPAAEMAQGQIVNGEVMLALGRAMIGRGQTVQAIGLFDAVEQSHPQLIESSAENTWAVALAHEGAGRFAKARSLYATLRQKYPASREAGWATARLNELAALHR